MYYHSMSSYVANAPIAIKACLLEATSECRLAANHTLCENRYGRWQDFDFVICYHILSKIAHFNFVPIVILQEACGTPTCKTRPPGHLQVSLGTWNWPWAWAVPFPSMGTLAHHQLWTSHISTLFGGSQLNTCTPCCWGWSDRSQNCSSAPPTLKSDTMSVSLETNFGLHLGYNVTLDIYRQMPKLVTWALPSTQTAAVSSSRLFSHHVMTFTSSVT